jgi:hypothetical protein
MSTEHTPGPWWATQGCTGTWYVSTRRDHQPEDAPPSPYGAAITCVVGDHTETRTSGNEEANARLIAAAPDLLAALHKVQDWLEGCSTRQTMQAQVARAIALATGEETNA